MPKTFSLELLPVALMNKDRRRGRVIHCHGCFDLLHIGHIRHLEEAKSWGDILVVTITSDAYVGKGKDRPIYTDTIRAEMVAALSCVDFVAINNAPSAIPAIHKIRPDFYVRGVDYIGSENDRLREEKEAIEIVGGRMVFTKTDKHSTTELIERLKA